MVDKSAVYALLNAQQIPFEAYEHPPVYTIEDMDALTIPQKHRIVKNLFLRDAKKRNYYLVTLPGHKPVNLKALAALIPSRPLSFASEQDLDAILGLKRGHVTPLGALNNADKTVTVVFDAALQGQTIGIHPMENTATVFIAFDDVVRLLKAHQTPIVLCQID